MRAVFLALLLLCCAPGARLAGAPAAEAAELRGPARPAEARPRRAPRASAAALASARAFLCPNGGTPQGRGRCSRGAGPAMGSAMGDDQPMRDWDQGLPPPTRIQVPCPPGTSAVPVRDQPGVTRCVAG